MISWIIFSEKKINQRRGYVAEKKVFLYIPYLRVYKPHLDFLGQEFGNNSNS
jgi:hypothetical protein